MSFHHYLAPLAIAVTVTVGCSTTQTGTPVTDAERSGQPATRSANETAPASASAAPQQGLAAVEPCDLLTAAEASSFGVPAQGTPDEVVGLRRCDWTANGAGFAITINDELGLAGLNLRGTVSDVTIGRHQAKREVESSGPGYCRVAFAVGETANVSLLALYLNNTPQACAIADQVAALIEPRLP